MRKLVFICLLARGASPKKKKKKKKPDADAPNATTNQMEL